MEVCTLYNGSLYIVLNRKEVGTMYFAEIKDFHGADYRFGSYIFKWVYYSALHFARQCCYLHADIDGIIIRFSNGMMMFVNNTGITIDCVSGIYDVKKEGK